MLPWFFALVSLPSGQHFSNGLDLSSRPAGSYIFVQVYYYTHYTFCRRLLLFLRHWKCKSRRNAKAIFFCSIVWCWITDNNTRVCSGFTVISFQRKCSMEVFDWTTSWFGRRVSTMELSKSLCRQSLSGMHVYCSCSLLLLCPTLDPIPSIVPSYKPWKHMMILTLVIIHMIHIIYNYIHYNNLNIQWFF